MNKICKQCNLPYDGSKLTKYCSSYCRIFAKNRAGNEKWANSKKKGPQLGHPWSVARRVLSGSDG